MSYACPDCKSKEITVSVSAFVSLNQDNDTETFDTEDAELDWDSNSMMACTDCGHSEIASSFKE